MSQIISKAMILFFVVGLVALFLFSSNGFRQDAEDIKVKTQDMLTEAQDSMTN